MDKNGKKSEEVKFAKYAGKAYTYFLLIDKDMCAKFMDELGCKDANLNIHVGKRYIKIHLNDMKIDTNIDYKSYERIDKSSLGHHLMICINSTLDRCYCFFTLNDINKKLNALMVPFRVNNMNFLSICAFEENGSMFKDYGEYQKDRFVNCLIKNKCKYRTMQVLFYKIKDIDEFRDIRDNFRKSDFVPNREIMRQMIQYSFVTEFLTKPFQDTLSWYRNNAKGYANNIIDNAFRCMTENEMESIGLDFDKSMINTYTNFRDGVPNKIIKKKKNINKKSHDRNRK